MLDCASPQKSSIRKFKISSVNAKIKHLTINIETLASVEMFTGNINSYSSCSECS